MIEFRFHNEYIDSTVAVQVDGSVIERYGVGGVVVTHPQTFPSVEDWLKQMERDTSLCSHDPRDDYDYDEDAEDENLLLWFVPTVYSCGGRKAANTPDGDVVEEGLVWQTSADWATEVIAEVKKVEAVGGMGVGVSGSHSNDDISSTMNANTMKTAPVRRSSRLSKKPAVNYTEVEEVGTPKAPVFEKTRPKTPFYLIATGSVASFAIPAPTPTPSRRSSRLAKKPAINYAEVVGILPAPTPEKPVVTETSKAPSTLSADEKRICDYIKGFLTRSETAKGRDAKAAIAVELFYFIAVFGKEFCAKHKRFRATVINKAYEFKKYESDMIDVVKASDTVLLALEASLEIPVPLPVTIPATHCGKCAGCLAGADKVRTEIEENYKRAKAAAAAEKEKIKALEAAEAKTRVDKAAVVAASAALTAAANALTAAVKA